MSRLPLSPLLKFLVFALVTALGTNVLGLTIANSRGGDTISYTARFTDATALNEGDEVRISGVKVGESSSMKFFHPRRIPDGRSFFSERHVPCFCSADPLPSACTMSTSPSRACTSCRSGIIRAWN